MATIEYNGYTLRRVQIDSWDTEPILADDGVSHATTRHTLRGTSLITGATGALFEDEYENARRRLLRRRGDLIITEGSTIIYDDDGVDQLEGPTGDFRIQRVMGDLSALVTFQIEYHAFDLLPTETTRRHAISHRWTQEWDIDESGNTVHRVVGVLQVRSDATSTNGTQTAGLSAQGDGGSNPDAYREIVMPLLPANFRRRRMRWLLDETGNRLAYEIESREYPRDLPHPAHSGTGTFTWTRLTQDGLALKHFEAELAGPAGVSPADLLDALVAVSKRRIHYQRDWLLEISVRESLFEENRIGLRIVAKHVLGEGADSGATQPLKPPTVDFSLVQDPMGPPIGGGPPGSAVPGYQDKNPYGNKLIRAVRRRLFEQGHNTSAPGAAPDHIAGVTPTSIPVAQFQEGGPWTGELATVATERQFTEATAEFTSAGVSDEMSDDHIANPYLSSRAVDRIEIEDNGVRWYRPQDLQTFDVPIQVRRPRVYIISEATVVRRGAAPDTPRMRPPVPGAILRSATVTPIAPTISTDAAAGHIFAATFRQVWELGYTSTSPGGTWGTNNGMLAFWPPENGVRVPLTPSISAELQLQTFHVLTPGGQYTIPVDPFPGLVT